MAEENVTGLGLENNISLQKKIAQLNAAKARKAEKAAQMRERKMKKEAEKKEEAKRKEAQRKERERVKKAKEATAKILRSRAKYDRIRKIEKEKRRILASQLKVVASVNDHPDPSRPGPKPPTSAQVKKIEKDMPIMDLKAFNDIIRAFRDGNVEEAVETWRAIKDPKDKLKTYLDLIALVTPKVTADKGGDGVSETAKVLAKYRARREKEKDNKRRRSDTDGNAD